MKTSFKFALCLGVAAISLTSCAGDKGPGKIGSEKDILVINKGIQNAKMASEPVKAEGEDFSSQVEQAQAVPAPEVAAPEQVPAPAPEQMATAAAPADVPTPATEPEQMSAPAPVAAPMVEQTAQAAPSSIPQTPAASPTMLAPVVAKPAVVPPPAPVKSTTKVPYPLDKNAPYSPKAVAEAQAKAEAAAATALPDTTTAPVSDVTNQAPFVDQPVAPSSSAINFNDPEIIRAVQARLSAKSLYKGEMTGVMNADLLNAISQYQIQNKMPIGPLNAEMLKLLGVIE